MDKVLYAYQAPEFGTWIYCASLLIIALFFKFGRLWSIRNLDLLLLVLFAPGLFLVEYGRTVEQSIAVERWGYIWLFSVGGLYLVRMLCDPMMVRRPLLEPNLSTGGLVFLGAALFLFLTVNVLTRAPTNEDLIGPQRLQTMLSLTDDPGERPTLSQYGPGFPWLQVIPNIVTRPLVTKDQDPSAEHPEQVEAKGPLIATARATAILSHLLVVVGLVLIGMQHYDNARTGIAMAALYLMLPYTAAATGQAYHCLPAALLTWAILCYRRPAISGMLLGLAAGGIYYPVFLLPLWSSFYAKRGLLRFVAGFHLTLGLLVASLAFTSRDWDAFWAQAKMTLGWTSMQIVGLQGFWDLNSQALAPYRIPVFVAFVVMSLALAIWPAQKNLGVLLSASAAIMLGVQFWIAKSGGLLMDWYLPLLLLTVFRPNLEDRVAVVALEENWFARRRSQLRVRAA